MDERIKNALGLVLVVVVVLFAYAISSFSLSYSKSVNPASFRSFMVSADDKVVAVPDVARFTFSVITEGGKEVGKLQQENTEKANAAIAFLKSMAIAQKDIETQSYNIEPRYQYFNCTNKGPCPPPEISGYTVRQSVQVKVRDFSKIGDIVSGTVKSGANSVSELSFTIDDPSLLQNQARIKAIAKAGERASALARAGGFQLGKLLSIDESNAVPQPYYYGAAEKFGMGGGGSPVPAFEPGSQEVTANVTLRFEMK